MGSHSWHDSGDAKWNALRAWHTDFVLRTGRSPRVWLDKYCIDQQNIDDDVRCLPIFLSGCQELLVLHGRTYLSRLWCIVEVFTFVHMGGNPSQISCRQLLTPGREEEDIERIQQLCDNF